jgi:hypothetical protein
MSTARTRDPGPAGAPGNSLLTTVAGGRRAHVGSGGRFGRLGRSGRPHIHGDARERLAAAVDSGALTRRGTMDKGGRRSDESAASCPDRRIVQFGVPRAASDAATPALPSQRGIARRRVKTPTGERRGEGSLPGAGEGGAPGGRSFAGSRRSAGGAAGSRREGRAERLPQPTVTSRRSSRRRTRRIYSRRRAKPPSSLRTAGRAVVAGRAPQSWGDRAFAATRRRPASLPQTGGR